MNYEELIDYIFTSNGKRRVILDRNFVSKTCTIIVEYVSNPIDGSGRLPDDKSTWVWKLAKTATGASWKEAFENLDK